MNRIRNVNEFFKVLSEGNVVELFDFYGSYTGYFKLKDNSIYASLNPDRDYTLSTAVSMDFEKNVYVKYVKPEWYNNIPEKGRLCWVWDNGSIQRYPGVVLGYNSDIEYKFILTDCGYQNAQLMTADEIKRYYE